MKDVKKWEDLPSIITPKDLEDLGFGANSARELFNSKGFPRIMNARRKHIADKLAVRLFFMGINLKEIEPEKLKILLERS